MKTRLPVVVRPAPLIPPPDLASHLGIPAKTLAEWRSNGVGPRFVRVGRHVRYRPEDIAAWLDENSHQKADRSA